MVPHDFPRAFPAGGELASAKLDFAEFLKNVSPERLPTDADFFTTLNRHALSSSLASQQDAQVVRSLRDEFGATGLVELTQSLPPRFGALLFAQAPTEDQYEVARLLGPQQLTTLVEELLRSNRMDKNETAFLFKILIAVRAGEEIPTAPNSTQVSDRGPEFDAAAALSILLPYVDDTARGEIFGRALMRSNGTFPVWYDGILFGDMLLRLEDDFLADLFLGIDVSSLAAWLSTQSPASRESILKTLPVSLRAAISSSTSFDSRNDRISLANRGRVELAAAFQSQLSHASVDFESVLT